MKKYKNKLITCGFILTVLVFSLWYGGGSPNLRGWKPHPSEADTSQTVSSVFSGSDETGLSKEETEEEKSVEKTDETVKEKQEEEAAEIITSASENDSASGDAEESKNGENSTDSNTAAENKEAYKHLPESVPGGTTASVESEDSGISDKEFTCTLSVRCDTILENMNRLDAEKKSLVPEDGVVLAEKTVSFYEGESVFNLLLREMKRNKIHMEFEDTPIYNSAYIEGIANIYEFDCGELSGWMYKVNGRFPNYGCSSHQLKAGDKVEWIYTCNLGVDIGGHYAAKGQMK